MAEQVSLVAKMEVRLRDMEKQMAKAGQIADKGVRNIEKRFASANPKLPAGLTNSIAGAFAVGAIAQFAAAGRDAIAVLADMADQAERIGTSTDFLQQFSYAVQLSGGTAEEAGSALEKFARGLSDAGRGAGDLGKIFEANGVSIRNAKGDLISVQEALSKYADLVKNAANPQDQLNLAVEAFGRSGGPALVNALRDGADGLASMSDEATKVGAVLDADVIAKAAELDDKFTQLEIVAGNWAKSLAVAIADFALPQLADLIAQINTVLNLLGTNVSTYFADPKLATGNAMLKARNGQKLGGKDDLSSFYDAQGDNFDAARLSMTLTKPTTKLPRSGGGGGGRRSRGGGSDRDRAAETIKELELELDKTTAVGAAREAIITKEKILQELRHANVDAVSEEGKKIAELVTAIQKAAEEQEKIIQAMDNIRDVAGAGLDTFTNGLLNGKSAAEALNDSLKDMLSTILQIAQKNLLEGLFGQSGQAGGGILSSIFGSFFGGGKASGGPVSAGKPYLIGEQGPELMVPTTSGTVIPNHALAGGGGGGNVQVNIINQNGSQVQQRTRQDKGMPVIDIVVAEMGKRLSNGDFDGPMKGRYGARPSKVR